MQLVQLLDGRMRSQRVGDNVMSDVAKVKCRCADGWDAGCWEVDAGCYDTEYSKLGRCIETLMRRCRDAGIGKLASKTLIPI